MSNAQDPIAISITASVRNSHDEQAHDDLRRYCDGMGLMMSTIQSGQHILITISGQAQNLMELITYLENVNRGHS